MKLKRERLLQLYPMYTSVLGPYLRKDGRKHVVLNASYLSNGTAGKTKTISYPKALVESNIGRRLLRNETIDHKDRDFTNNSSKNLVILTLSEHASLDALRVHVKKVTCPTCGNKFTPTVAQRNQQGRTGQSCNKAGPFCSRRCSGIYGKSVQTGGIRLDRNYVVKEYFKLKK